MTRGTTPNDLPAGALTVRLTPRQRTRLERLVQLLDATQTQVVNTALVHLLATLEAGEPIRATVPSERPEPKGGPS